MTNFLTIYGRQAGIPELLPLDALTIQASPEVLRTMASFFLACAEAIASNKSWDHEHLKDCYKSEFSHAPDIVVASPPQGT